MKYCPHCGNELEKTAVFCTNCGGENRKRIR
ncbi:zinc-ribbon domain-containing protein [Vagococcus sp.]